MSICEGYALPDVISRLAGRDATEYLMQILTEREYSFTATAERDFAVKEKLRYIVVDYDTEHKSTTDTDKEKTFELPDENFITVSVKRFHCVKVFFQPSFSSKEANGVHDTSFMKCDVDIRKELHALAKHFNLHKKS